MTATRQSLLPTRSDLTRNPTRDITPIARRVTPPRPPSDRNGGRFQIGMGGRLQIGIPGRLHRNPHAGVWMKSRILADVPDMPAEFGPTSQAIGLSRLLDTTPRISPVFKNSTSAYLLPLTKQIATPPSADATTRVGGNSSTKSCSSIADAHAIVPSEGLSAPSGQRQGSFLTASSFAK